MGYITVLANNVAWVICRPADQKDLDQFLVVSADQNPGPLLHRTATSQEAQKCAAAYAIYLHQGGDADKFFGIPA